MFSNKKGQWVRAQMREQRSADRASRMQVTKELAKQGQSADEIAMQVGVSGNTVRQYLRELKPLIQEELFFEKKSAAFDKLQDEIATLGENLHSKQSITKFVNKYIDALDVLCDIINSANRLGNNVREIKSNLKDIIKSAYSTLYSAVILSTKATFSNPKNSKHVAEEEITIVEQEFKKWTPSRSNAYVLKDDYRKFIEKVEELDTPEKVENLKKIVSKVEKEIGLSSHLNKLDKAVERMLPKVGMTVEDIPTKGLGFSNRFLIHFLCNFFLPGLGTLIYSQKKTMRIVMGILQAFWIFIPKAWFVFWLWAWIYSIVIRKKLS